MTTVKQSIIVDTSPAHLWAIATDIDHWRDWYVGLENLSDISGKGSEAGTTYRVGAKLAGMIDLNVTGKVEEVIPDKLWRGSTSGAMDGMATWSYAPVEGGKAEVTVEFEYSLGENVLARVADRLFMERKVNADMQTTLEQLKARAEAST